jgi:hypothetical protein
VFTIKELRYIGETRQDSTLTIIVNRKKRKNRRCSRCAKLVPQVEDVIEDKNGVKISRDYRVLIIICMANL